MSFSFSCEQKTFQKRSFRGNDDLPSVFKDKFKIKGDRWIFQILRLCVKIICVFSESNSSGVVWSGHKAVLISTWSIWDQPCKCDTRFCMDEGPSNPSEFPYPTEIFTIKALIAPVFVEWIKTFLELVYVIHTIHDRLLLESFMLKALDSKYKAILSLGSE